MDEAMRGLAAGRVTVTGWPGATTVTDPAGGFAIAVPPSSGLEAPDITFEVPGYAPVAVPAEGLAEPFVVVLRPGAALQGRVRAPSALRRDLAATDVWLAGSGLWPPTQLAVDAQGRFVATGLSEGIYFLSARLTSPHGSALSGPSPPLALAPGQTENVTLALSPGRDLEIEVVSDAPDGPKPVVGARVSAATSDLIAVPAAGLSDAVGQVTLAGLPRQEVALQVEAPGFLRWTGRSSGERLRVVLTLGARLAGRITDTSGRPVGDALIRVGRIGADRRDPAGNDEALSLGALAFGSLGVTRGPIPDLPLTASDGLATAQGASNNGPSRPGSALGLPFGAAPAPNAVRTDGQGRFELTGLPAGELRVFVAHPDFGPVASPPIELSGEPVAPLELVLPAPATLTIDVSNATGQPVANAPVRLAGDQELDERAKQTDAFGRAVFERVGGSYQVTCFVGSPRQVGQSIVVAADRKLRLALPDANHRLIGRVFDRLGQPVAAARIRIAPGERPPLELWSEPDGTFEAADLPGPPYLVSADHPDYAETRITVDQVDGPLSLHLLEGRSVAGTLVEASTRQPLDGVTIVFRRKGRSWRTRSNQGLFEIHGLSPGSYRVSTESEAHENQAFEWTIPETGKPQSGISLALTALGHIAGEVVDRLGNTVSNARVTAEGVARRHALTNQVGHFELRNLPPGEHLLWARHDGAGRAASAETVKVRPGELSPGAIIRLPEVARGMPEPTDDVTSRDESDDQTGAPSAADAVGSRMFTLPAVTLAWRDGPVVTDTASAEGGLRVGDMLLEIDGERVLSLAQARAMLRGAPGSRVRVRIRRAGRPLRLRLTRP